MTRRALTHDQETELVKAYADGTTSAALARQYGVCKPTVVRIVKRHGVERAPTGRRPWRSFTDEESVEMGRLWSEGLSQSAIAARFSTTQLIVSRVLQSHGITPEKRLRPRRREASNLWKGGRVRNGGYWMVHVAPDAPFAAMRNSEGYIMEHRLVMARHLGRPLSRSETVHHINGDHEDNRLENLQVRQGRHGKGVAMICADCGSRNIRPDPLD